MKDFTELMEEVEKITGNKLPDAAHGVIGKYIGEIIRRDAEQMKAMSQLTDQFLRERNDAWFQINTWVTLRPEVQRFALAMEERLKANDHKGGWKRSTVEYLFNRSGEERRELLSAISDGENILAEAADVANFAMMIADVCGELK